MKELSGDLDELQDSYLNKWADTKRNILGGVAFPDNNDLQRYEDTEKRHEDTESAIRQIYETMMDHINETPSIEIIRDANGRATAIKKGKRTLKIDRGPDGRAKGLQ